MVLDDELMAEDGRVLVGGAPFDGHGGGGGEERVEEE